MRSITAAAVAATLWLVPPGGAARAADADPRPVPRPLGRELKASAQDAQPVETADPQGELTLRAALAVTLLQSPELASFSWEVRAREAEALQAGLLPNPALDAELENFAGSGPFAGVGSSEATLVLGQLIELGGKRARRRQVAELSAELAGWDYEAARLDVLTETSLRFVTVLAAQERLAQARELHELARRVYRTVSDRVEAGKVSPVEQSRAQVPLSAAEMGLEQAGVALRFARRRLAASWGGERAVFERAVGRLDALAPVPAREALVPLLRQAPELARWETELRERRARLDLERARAVPDVTVFAGGRRLAETGDGALVAGLSVPLPLFDRNQGAVEAAGARERRAQVEARAARNASLARLAESYRDLRVSAASAATLKAQVLPAAEEAVEATMVGYQIGKFGILEVLDAQRTLFEVKAQHLDALYAYHRARTEVERLIGAALPDAPAADGKRD